MEAATPKQASARTIARAEARRRKRERAGEGPRARPPPRVPPFKGEDIEVYFLAANKAGGVFAKGTVVAVDISKEQWTVQYVDGERARHNFNADDVWRYPVKQDAQAKRRALHDAAMELQQRAAAGAVKAEVDARVAMQRERDDALRSHAQLQAPHLPLRVPCAPAPACGYALAFGNIVFTKAGDEARPLETVHGDVVEWAGRRALAENVSLTDYLRWRLPFHIHLREEVLRSQSNHER